MPQNATLAMDKFCYICALKCMCMGVGVCMTRVTTPCHPRVCGAQPAGPGAPAGVLLAGGADDRADVEVCGPARQAHFLPRPLSEQVNLQLTSCPPPHTCTSIVFPLEK